MEKAKFYHAGCSVCVSAEKEIVEALPEGSVEVIHLGEQKELVGKAEAEGVKSVPALVMPSGAVLHINFGASIEALKN
ncbi:thioredoxin family protein [Flavobacterium sp.]|uniref:thioredoxin family protein n=1 Tax=Flavobacterium sp. TaxID=239 RepID=UPI003D0DF151